MMHATSRVGQCKLLIQIFSLAFLILPSMCQPLRIPWKPCTEGGKASICLSPERLNRAHSSSLSAHLGVRGWVYFYLDLAKSRNGLRLKKKLIEIRKLEEKDGLGLMWRKWIDLILGMWSVKFQKSFSWRCLKWCRKEIWPQEDQWPFRLHSCELSAITLLLLFLLEAPICISTLTSSALCVS